MLGERNGQRTLGWSPSQELQMWQKRESPKGHRHRPLFHEIKYGRGGGGGVVSPVSCHWCGWAEDDGNEVERGGKHKRKFILEQSAAPIAAASFRKVRSCFSHPRPGVWRAFWMINNLYLVRSDQRWGWEAQITTDYRILVDSKSLRPSKDVFYFIQLRLFGDQ